MKISVNTQSSIRIEEEKVFYFDPFQIEEERHDADYIFITHDHYDHFSIEDIKKIEKEDTVFIIPDSMYQKLGGPNVVCLFPNDKTQLDNINIEAVASYNNHKKFHPMSSGYLGYIVEIDNKRVYVMGDCDKNHDNEGIKADVVFIPIGGTYTFNFTEASAYINELKPELVIPTHYGSIVGNKKDGESFKNLVDSEIEVKLLLEK